MSHIPSDRLPQIQPRRRSSAARQSRPPRQGLSPSPRVAEGTGRTFPESSCKHATRSPRPSPSYPPTPSTTCSWSRHPTRQRRSLRSLTEFGSAELQEPEGFTRPWGTVWLSLPGRPGVWPCGPRPCPRLVARRRPPDLTRIPPGSSTPALPEWSVRRAHAALGHTNRRLPAALARPTPLTHQPSNPILVSASASAPAIHHTLTTPCDIERCQPAL